MPESLVQVTEGVGKKLHTWQRTIGANNVEDEVVLFGEQYLATYNVTTANVSIATAADHILQIMAGASLNVYVRSIRVWQLGLATAAAIIRWQLLRLTTAGTGGTVVTPAPLDPTDGASGATAMNLPTVKGTESTKFLDFASQTIQTVGAGGPGLNTLLVDLDFDKPRSKPYRIAAGAANGIALKQITGAAAATVLVEARIVEASF